MTGRADDAASEGQALDEYRTAVSGSGSLPAASERDVDDDGMRRWLSRPAVEVAPELLGCVLRHESDDGVVAIRLTEVEAYMGSDDPGSHAYRGRTRRNEVMFGPSGHLYVYRHLGLHHCVNLVCGPDGVASAVLLRAGEAVEGGELARGRREAAGVVRRETEIASGPARLAVALGLDMRHYGENVLGDGSVTLTISSEPVPEARVSTGPRVGVNGDGGDPRAFPWRFWIESDPTVSKYRPSGGSRASARRGRD